MGFIGGGTRREWWFATDRLTVIEQSTGSGKDEKAAHTAEETYLGPEGLRGKATREGALEWQLDTDSSIIILDCQSEIFSNVWSWEWIIYSAIAGFLFKCGIWCCRGWEEAGLGAIWSKNMQEREWMKWLKMRREGRLDKTCRKWSEVQVEGRSTACQAPLTYSRWLGLFNFLLLTYF